MFPKENEKGVHHRGAETQRINELNQECRTAGFSVIRASVVKPWVFFHAEHATIWKFFF